MNKRVYYLMALCCIFATSCCNVTTSDEDIVLSQQIAKARAIIPTQSSYSVNEALVNKYINLTKPNKTIQKITPIVRNTNDTLAYIVQFLQGWELVAGDTRITPSLAFSETGILDLDEYNREGTGGIYGLVDVVEQTKQSTDTMVNATWKFLLPRQGTNYNDNGIAPCGDVAGMWVPVDTQYIDNGDYVPHLISTRWHQDSPYNNVCKDIFLGSYGYQKSLVGCGPIACSQVIFKYLEKKNPDSISIPATCAALYNGHLLFSDFSTSQWSNLRSTNNSLSTFITYVGQEIMGAEYCPYIDASLSLHREIGVESDDCRAALDWAHLQYRQDSVYNWQTIVSSLQSRNPIIVAAFDSTHENGHAFIIDALNITDIRVCIDYEWKDDYHPDYWELQTYPAWMFDTSVMPGFKGDGERYQEEIILDKNIKVAMNWGYGSSTYDNVFYLLRDGSSTISPSWTVNGTTYCLIERLFLNIRQ